MPLLVSVARLISPAFVHSNFRIPTAKLKQCSVQRCPDIRKSSALSEGSHPSPACPSDKSSISMEISMEHWYCDIDNGATEVLGEKPVPVPLYPPQIPHGLVRDRSRVFAVRGWSWRNMTDNSGGRGWAKSTVTRTQTQIPPFCGPSHAGLSFLLVSSSPK